MASRVDGVDAEALENFLDDHWPREGGRSEIIRALAGALVAGRMVGDPAPVDGDLRERLADVLAEHRPSQWRSFTNASLVLRCCGQDFGNPTAKVKRGDLARLVEYEAHLADALLPIVAAHVAELGRTLREEIAAELAAFPTQAYPEDVFGPGLSTDDTRAIRDALAADSTGITLDRISAAVMRHAYKIAAAIARGEKQ